MTSHHQTQDLSPAPPDAHRRQGIFPSLNIKISEVPASLSAGLVIGLLALFMQASYAAMIFSGELGGFLPQGMGILLLGALIMGLIVTLTSTYSGSIAMPQDSAAAIMGVVAGAIVASMSMADPTATFATVVAAMMVSSVITGGLLWLLGRFNLGRLVRYMPYPVIGGFLAGTGWLLLTGGISVMTDGQMGLGLLDETLLVRWVPGLIFATVLLLLTRRFAHFLILPALLLVTVGLFYLAYYQLNGEIESAQASGWLLGPFPQGGLFQPATVQALTKANWFVVLGNAVNLSTIFIVGIISFLLNATGLEIATRSNVDLNRELKTVGIANVAIGMTGSSVGYHILSFSTLGYRLNATSRLVGLVSSAVVAGALFFGAELLAIIPNMVAGGFLIFLGLAFLADWLYDAWFKLAKLDYALIWLILIVIILFGMLQGIFVGILVSALLFVISYTSTRTVRHSLTRENYQSYVMRSVNYEEILREQGKQLSIFELQGYIFFGSAHTLVEQLQSQIEESQPSEMRFVLLDFRLVTGVDSSAMLSFSRLKQVADQAEIVLILTNLADPIKRQLQDIFIHTGDKPRSLLFAELDQGVAWAEDLIVANTDSASAISTDEAGSQSVEPIPQTFLQYFEKTLTPPTRVPLPDSGHANSGQVDSGQLNATPSESSDGMAWYEARALAYMDKIEVEPGTVLLREGEPVDKAYFIEEGKIVIYTELADGEVKQLRIQEAGTVFGEIGIYSGQMATATVAAKDSSLLYTLSAENFALMESEDPELAIATHRLIANILGRKLTQANYTIVALQK